MNKLFLFFFFLCGIYLIGALLITNFKSERNMQFFVNKQNKIKIKLESTRSNNELEKNWRSGYIKHTNHNRRRSNDPWWMHDDEKNNPRFLPPYSPWWSTNNTIVTNAWKINELRSETKTRGISSAGLKAELIHRLVESSKKYDLSDDNFTTPNYISAEAQQLHTCYPEVYEGGEENIQKFKLQIMEPLI
jgi:hypothetical protein